MNFKSVYEEVVQFKVKLVEVLISFKDLFCLVIKTDNDTTFQFHVIPRGGNSYAIFL